MDFGTLRDKLLNGQDAQFTTQQNVQIAGRTAELLSIFDSRTARTLLGIMPISGTTHAHEYRLLFAVPTLDENTLADWWQYALKAADTLVQPDKDHNFSLVSVILAVSTADKAALRKLKKLSCEQQFQGGKQGWSSVRMAVIDLGANKVYTNRMGDSLKNILQPLL